MLPRFYTPDLDVAGPFALSPNEAAHLSRVLRLAPGDAVELFDGRGGVYRAVVAEAGRERAIVRVVERLPVLSLPTPRVTVVQAALKGSNMDDAVRDATMMGAVAVQPVISEHVVVKATQVKRPENHERWTRVAIAAAKQCRRATLPVVLPVQRLDEWLTSDGSELRLIFVEPSVHSTGTSLRSLEPPAGGSCSILLGPEGGWAGAEVAAALDAGCVPISLGPMTLRAESMAVAALAAVWAVWGG